MAREERLVNPQSTEETTSSIPGLLASLVDEQLRELETGEIAPISIKTRKQLLRWFQNSQRFRNAYREAIPYFLVPMTDGELKKNRHRFAGKLYQSMAFSYTAGRQPEGQVLLSPARTYDFYEGLYPDAPRVKNRFGLDSLQGISVPDGLRISVGEDSHQINAVYEYTLTGSSKYFLDKIAAFNQNNRKYSRLFGQSRIAFVLPHMHDFPGVLRKSRAMVSFMPFKHSQFRDFTNKVIYKYRSYKGNPLNPDEVSTTLAEFQNFARQRADSYAELNEHQT